MSNLTDLPALAAEHGWAVDTSAPDYFGEIRATAIGDTGTVRMLFDKHGKMVSAYLNDTRRRTFRTTRIGVLKGWLETAA